MIQWILFFTLSFNLFALEISIDSAKENFQYYSILHLKNSSRFLCQEEKDDFEVVTKIICAFNKKPTQKIAELQDDFFKITSTINKNTFFLFIEPYKKMKLIPMVFDLVNDDDVYQADVKVSNNWMVVGYKDKLPLINNKKSDEGINFPFVMKKDRLPFVGGLDIKGNPVHIKKVQDVTDYLKIKKYYEEKKYNLCLELIEDVLLNYPNSLFKAELLFYKIRVYAKLNDNDNIIELSKIYLADHSSDENVPEVLSLTADAYSKIGLNIDADYFFDRLFSEHQSSIYTKWGYIYKGEMLEASGGASKAIFFYKKALNETDNIELAATAAYRLATHYSSTSKQKEAAKYVMKIIKAKPNHFMNEFKKSMDMMYTFADESDYTTASAIAKAIIDEIDKNHDEYERLLKDRGIWLSKTENKQAALDALNRYIKEYKYGDFEEVVKVAKDSLFFETTEDNSTIKLSQYDELISEYRDDTIGDRAIYEKAKLLLEKGMYSDVLGFKESVLELDGEKYSDTKQIIIDAATGSMKSYLKQNECQEVLNISNEYNITLSAKWDDGVYRCAMKGGDYKLSKSIATKNLKTKDLDERKRWLYRYIKIDFATGNYNEVLNASKDLILLIEDELAQNSEYKDIYRYQFDTYQRLEDSNSMLKLIDTIQTIFGVTYKDIERYAAILTIGSDLKDNNIIIKYAKNIMKIQKSTMTYIQSPYVEFTLYQAYTTKEDYNNALEVIKSLDSIELSKEKRSRQKYMLGSVLTKLWRDEEAQKAYQESIDADATTAWAKLAKSAKEI